MILCDKSLRKMLPELIALPLGPDGELMPPGPAEYALVNPASVDLRIGRTLRVEDHDFRGRGYWRDIDLLGTSKENCFWLEPGQFALVSTYEWLMAPNYPHRDEAYALELRLKSSRAREGYNHSLAFWFDPGWRGIGTMEITNLLRYSKLPLWYGMRFGQMIVDKLDGAAENPYDGKYQNASTVESTKDRTDGAGALALE